MRFEHDGMSLWLEQEEPATGQLVQAGADVTIMVGVEPADASNRVQVHYRVNGGPTATVSADPVRHKGNAQYFRARLPAAAFRAGDKVDYVAICRCAGRQVPSAAEAEQLPLSFQVVAADKPTPAPSPHETAAETGLGMGRGGSLPLQPPSPLGMGASYPALASTQGPGLRNVPQAGVPQSVPIPAVPPAGGGSANLPVKTGSDQPPFILTAPTPPPAPSVADAERALGEPLPQDVRGMLSRYGVNTLGDLSRIPAESLTGTAAETVSRLRALSRLSTLTPDLTAAGKLVARGLNDPFAVASAAPKALADALGVDAAAPAVPQLQAAARSQARWLEKVAVDWRVATPAVRARLPANAVLASQVQECKCEDCLSAVSPVAYLADLVDYFISYVFESIPDVPPIPVDPDRFCQPITELLVSCADVSRQVHQVRICIEVLRCFQKAVPPPDNQQGPLASEELAYRLGAYRLILQRQGTSVDEVRLSRSADPDTRQQLADRLGIELGSARPDHLDALALDTKTTLTEEALETLFGLVDTTRYPLSDGVTRNDTARQILRWNVENIAFGRNTDGDGVAYLKVTYVANQPKPYHRIDVHRDAARTHYVATGNDFFEPGVVALSALNGGLLRGRVELDYQADSATIELQLLPKLVAWRLDHLRTLWAEADRPPNLFVDFPIGTAPETRLPIIDPDIIGVDDLRFPYPKPPSQPDAAFDVWLRRRTWVDQQLKQLRLLTKQVPLPSGPLVVPDFNQLLLALTQPVQYGAGNNPVTVWPSSLGASDLDRIVREFGRPETAAAARQYVTQTLHLGLTAFARLMELQSRDHQGQSLLSEEWEEVFSILVQAQKQALIDPDTATIPATPGLWLREESTLQIDLGPEAFSISATEPLPGAWPPVLGAAPLIDPDLKRIALPDDVAGRRSVVLWRARQRETQAFNDALQNAQLAQPQTGLEPLLVKTYGLAPAGGWVAHLQDLLVQLTGAPDPTPAEQEITGKLFLSIDDFTRLTALATRAQSGSNGPALAPSEWDEVFAMLTGAWKIGQRYSAWITEEQNFGFNPAYWWALKAALPAWRAQAETRQAWQQALRDRSGPPVIDPDQLAIEDFIDYGPSERDAAYHLYVVRQTFVANELSVMSQVIAQAPSAIDGFDALLLAALFTDNDDTRIALGSLVVALDADRVAYGAHAVTALLQQVFGPDLPNFDQLLSEYNGQDPQKSEDALRTITESLYLAPRTLAIVAAMQSNANPTPADWQRFEGVLAESILIGQVMGLVQVDAGGDDITPRLDQLGLSYDAFDRLVQLRQVAAMVGTLDDDEWAAVYSILAQSRKLRRFSLWRDEEKEAQIVGGPDYFQIPLVDPLQFPPPAPPPTDPWRFYQRTRNLWDETLRSRIDEQQSVIDAMAQVVATTEETMLPQLRDALIQASAQAFGVSDLSTLANKQEAATRRLQIDAAARGCQTTTRVSQAIRTVQGILLTLRNGIQPVPNAYIYLADTGFDERWQWLGSYSTWRAAMFVFLYPENILVPTLRRVQSPGFQALVDASRAPGGLTPEGACKAAKAYAAYFRDLFFLKPVATCQARTPPPPASCQTRQPSSDRYLVYTFALTDDQQRLYWMTYDTDANEAVDRWRQLEAVDNIVEVLGAVPAKAPSGTRYISLAYLRRQEEDVQLCVIRYNLGTDQWDSDPIVLRLPSPLQQRGNVALRQMQTEGNSLHFAVQDAATRDIFDNYFNLDRKDWYRGWSPIARPISFKDADGQDMADIYPATGDLVAMIESEWSAAWPGGYWLVLSAAGKMFIRIIWGASTPVYRLRGIIGYIGPYLYTTDITERESVIAQSKYTYEGIPFYTLADKTNPLGAPFQPYNRYKGEYTGNNVGDYELALATPTDPSGHFTYTYEGTIGYVGGKEALIHEMQQKNGQHYYTASDLEQNHMRKFYFSDLPSNIYVISGNDVTTWITINADYQAVRIVSPYEVYVIDTYNNWYQLVLPPNPQPAPISVFRFLHSIVPHSGGAGGSANPQKYWVCGIESSLFGSPPSFGATLNSITKTANGFNNTNYDWIEESFTDLELALCSQSPFDLSSSLSSSDFKNRRRDEVSLARYASVIEMEYLREAYFFVPIQLALQLLASGQTAAALEYLRMVYDWSAEGENRKIYFGLTAEEKAPDYTRPQDWLLDALNPHAIAESRGYAYTFFTLLTLVRTLLADADAEFTRDTVETLERARVRYQQALDLLQQTELAMDLSCTAVLSALEAPAPGYERAMGVLRARLSAITSLPRLTAVVDEIRGLLTATDQPPAARIAGALAHVASAPLTPKPTLASKLAQSTQQSVALAALLDDPIIAAGARQATQAVGVMPLQSVALFNFCLPPNPVLRSLRFHADLNLYKLRNCRNIAGLQRQIDPYGAPIDASTGLPSIGPGGQLNLPGMATIQPTAYRYATLIERAKQLQQLANQTEAAMLTALEKRDAGAYSLLRARQDLHLANAQVQLQGLKVQEAQGGVRLAQLQQARAELQHDQYDRMINSPIGALENAGLAARYVQQSSYIAAALTAPDGLNIIYDSGGSVSGAFTALGNAAGAAASIFEMTASYERRQQGWEDQRDLAQEDVLIGQQQVANALGQVQIATQEQNIAGIQADNAQTSVDYLANQFTNVELYDFMSAQLERVYSYFLREATAIARLAQNQLAFERQEVPPPFIQADYWQAPDDTAATSSGSGAVDRRGLTGSARLLQDIYQLDEYAMQTNQRKLQLTRTLSLASLFPIEFALFQQSGQLPFTTTLELFDREFPGHYLRLIRRVRTSVVALVPATLGIRATLSTTGLSRVVVASEPFQTAVVRRDPQSISYTSPRDATGVFDLDPQSELLLPFEGTGVAADWRFEMPRAANAFDYRTLADVLITFEYSALDSYDYRQQVLRTRSPDLSAERAFSFVNNLADAWYDLHNPDQTATPMSVTFRTERDDFPPNVDDVLIQQVALLVLRAEGLTFELPVSLRFRPDGAAGAVGGTSTTVDGLISTRSGNGASWFSMIGKPPVGQWQLTLPNSGEVHRRLAQEQVTDIVFVVTFTGRTPPWPA